MNNFPDTTYMDMDDIIGNPEEQAEFWEQQSLDDSCAIMAQVSLLNQFGVDLTESQAVYESAANGWYTPGSGTQPCDVGNLMELHGVPTHDVQNATVADLAAELKQGHGVIVGVRSSELWDQGLLAEFKQWLCKVFGFDNSTYNPADHAVTVTGIDVSDLSNPMVIINDSGCADGAGHPYPLEKFLDAWENSDFTYIATNDPIPHDKDTMGDLEELDVNKWVDIGKWVVGGAATLFTTVMTDGDLATGLDAGKLAFSAVENLFDDPSAIRSI